MSTFARHKIFSVQPLNCIENRLNRSRGQHHESTRLASTVSNSTYLHYCNRNGQVQVMQRQQQLPAQPPRQAVQIGALHHESDQALD